MTKSGKIGMKTLKTPVAPPVDESPRGTDLPQDLVDRVSKILISHIGYTEVREAPAVSEGSLLSHTNEVLDTDGVATHAG